MILDSLSSYFLIVSGNRGGFIFSISFLTSSLAACNVCWALSLDCASFANLSALFRILLISCIFCSVILWSSSNDLDSLTTLSISESESSFNEEK